MNISFNTNKKVKHLDDPIKEQLNYFKLKVDESNRSLNGFEIFQDDNKIMCYVNDLEIEFSFDGNKLVDIDYYSDEKISNKLKLLINNESSICDNLIKINNFFNELEKKEISKEKISIDIRKKSRLQKIFDNDDDDEEANFDNFISESDSDVELNNDSPEHQDSIPKESKSINFEFNIVPKSIIPDLSDDIILTDDISQDNYISFEIINNSKNIGKNSTIYQIVNEINKAIRNTKNIIIKPINDVFNISVENTLLNGEFKYLLIIPDRYPFFPPKISIKSNFNQSFTYALNNCEILNENKWNPSTTLQDIILGIFNNVNKLDFSSLKSNINDSKFNESSIKLLELTNTEPLNSKTYILNFDFLKIQDKSNNRGIGYDYDKTKIWDVNTYMKEQDAKNKKIAVILNDIFPYISKNSDVICDTCIIPYIKECIYDVSILEIEKRKDYYEILFKVFFEIYKLEKYNSNFDMNKICSQRMSLQDYPKIFECIPILEKKIVKVDSNDYVNVMKELAFGPCNIVGSRKFKFMNQTKETFTSPDFMKRLTSEIKILNSSLPISETSSIFLRFDESNMSIMKFLIIPHPDTPYAYGCFEFDMYLPYNYPQSPPHVEIITTGGGTFRFNPNLYDNGKVCLSLLGTWSGTGGETWSPNSTILQVLISIQSLIFCEEPYFNEPGYERDRNNAKGKDLNDKYNEPVRYQTMKLGMLEQLRNPTFGFEDVIKNHFRIHKDKIFKKLNEWEKIATNKASFQLIFNQMKTHIAML